MLAVWERISAYGITENRYLAFVTGLWLISVIVVLIRSRASHIRYIPISLAALMLAIMVGPWGMFSVSKSSQQTQLEQVLNQAGISDRPLTSQTGAALDSLGTARTASIVQYLFTTHGSGSLQGFIADTTLARLDSTDMDEWEAIRDLKAALGLKELSEDPKSARYIQIVSFGESVPTLGYAYSRQIQFGKTDLSSDAKLRFNPDTQMLTDGVDSVSVAPVVEYLMTTQDPKVENTVLRLGDASLLFIDMQLEQGTMMTGQAVVLTKTP
jgi:hypothetical protein